MQRSDNYMIQLNFRALIAILELQAGEAKHLCWLDQRCAGVGL